MKWESRVSLSAVILSKALHTASTREEISLWGQVRYRVEPEPGSKVHGEPWIRQLPDPDPAETGSVSGLSGSRSGKSGSGSGSCRIQIR